MDTSLMSSTRSENGGRVCHLAQDLERTLLVERGVDHKTIAEIVGHSDVRLMKNVYQHAQQESKRAGLAKVGKFLGGWLPLWLPRRKARP
jgi:hypothetical protein